ncbi:transcriptional regulator [Alteribacillus persepolensis]|uniref:Transcriptional regulator n=1 Tax=Alteribacillus persepolensis TaxID=568899 RepID=A0A1G7Y7H0_9BACI|nr:LysR family transcriptional regulator [Alteribacillus persepolensis]SDG92398.1 transcriptional regulator [Alteribacillus persepolensis]
MDLRQLTYFLTVCDTYSFTKAARKLRIAQPAITKAIQQLENEVGLPLFIREKRHVRLTMEGRVLKQHAIDIQQKIQQAKKELHDMKEGICGTVQVGIPSMSGSYYFPEKLAQFQEKYPDIDIDIYEAGTTEIERDILEGRLEMGTVVVDDVSNNLDIHPFLQESLMLVVSPSHPLAAHQAVSIEQLADEKLIVFKGGYYHRRIIEQVGASTKKDLSIAFETNQIAMAKSLTAKNFGVSVFLNMVVSKDEDVTAIPFDPPIVITLGIAHKKDLPLSKANRLFLSFLTKNADTSTSDQ